MRDSIVLDSVVLTNFGLPPITVPSADLVMIVTARPSPNIPIAGFAVCLQRDQWNRCTVGWFNWVPALLNVAQTTYDSVIESEMHTALHEFLHVLGGLNPALAGTPTTSMFISWAGGAPALQQPSALLVTEGDTAFPSSGRTIVKVATPAVLNTTRAVFGCPNATGLPLEDVPLGVASHWEARVTGGEFMSYGTRASQIIVSAFTLAYLTDTGQYAVNSSAGGIVFPTLGPPLSDAGVLGTPRYSSSVAAAAPTALPVSWPLYGRGAGCGFVDGPPAAWPDAYKCAAANTFGCTPDYRMSAKCVVDGAVAAQPTVYSKYVSADTGAILDGPPNTQAPNVPLAFWPFSTAAAAVAASGVAGSTPATTAGFSAAMDYVPVPVGYWSCNAATQSSNTSVGAESSGGLSSLTSLFIGGVTDMTSYAGQARCDTCRCMISTLLPLTQSVTLTKAASYGLCYVTNCYSANYLQVGILSHVGAGSISWYACPPAGGNIFIVGYTGYITCPPAAQFCALQTVSALLYSETVRAVSKRTHALLVFCLILHSTRLLPPHLPLRRAFSG